MLLPSKEQAHAYLAEAAELNPGAWITHSEYAAQAAFNFATRIAHLDADAAYIMALLHDIGRRKGVFNLIHSYHGYQFMLEEGYPDAARICITHSFPEFDTSGAPAYWDGTAAELADLRHYLTTIEYNDYDRLIQLCDAVSTGNGYWLIEKRLLDVGLRRGVHSGSPNRWRKTLALKDYFEVLLGESVYSFLPGVIENTFGFSPNGKEDK